MFLHGLKIHVAASWPKMQLSADCPVTDDFRKEMNAWMLDFFGTECLVPKGQAIEDGRGNIWVRPEDYEALRKAKL